MKYFLKRLIPLLATGLLFSSCALFTDDVRISGGQFKQTSAGIYQKQGKDPKEPTSFTKEESSILIPAGSVVTIGTNKVTLSSNTVYSVSKLSNQFGAAQKNTLGLYAEKLKALSWLTWLGALMVIFGAVSAFYPPLKAIVNSLTTSLVITAVGIGFIALPTLLVGHEILILCIGLGAAGIYWFAHRHGGLSATVQYLKNEVESTTNSPK